MTQLRRLSGPALLLLLSIALLWKITLTNQYTWLNSGDLVNQVLPWFQFQRNEWHHGRLPLWDPYHWAGQSLIGQDQPGVLYPLNWILFLLPAKAGHIARGVLNWYLLAIHYMAALFAYLLARDLGRSRLASVTAGVAYSFLGYMAATGWPQMLNGAVWVPLVFLMFFRVLRGSRPLLSSALCGTFLGVSYLSGHHQIPMFASLAMLGCWIYLFFRRGRISRRRFATCFLLFLFCLFAFAAPQILPGEEYWRLALRWVGSQNALGWGDRVPYVVHTRFSMNPVTLVKTVVPNLPGQGEPFLGFAVLALCVIGAFTFRGKTEVRVLISVAILAFLYSLGGYSVFEGLLYAIIPNLDKARNPAAALCIAEMACAALAAFGLDAVRRFCPGEAAERIRAVGWVTAAAAVLLLGILMVDSAVQPDRAPYLFYFGSAALAACTVAAILLLATRGALSATTAVVLLSMVVFFEAGSTTGYSFPHREEGWGTLDKLTAFDDVAQFLHARPDLERVRVDIAAIPFNFGDWYGVEEIEGYCGVTKNIFYLATTDSARMMLGETFWVGKNPSRPGQEPVFTGVSGVRVFRNPDAFPRAWAVHATQPVHGWKEMVKLAQGPAAVLRNTAFLETRAPVLESCTNDQVSVVSREPRSVVLRAQMGCKGMVVLSDSYFPGWKAKIDGRPANLYAVDTAIMGVVVNSGTHRIEIGYFPASFYWGVALFVLGVMVVVGLLLMAQGGHGIDSRSSPRG